MQLRQQYQHQANAAHNGSHVCMPRAWAKVSIVCCCTQAGVCTPLAIMEQSIIPVPRQVTWPLPQHFCASCGASTTRSRDKSTD
eukprot:3340329-Amphidinium_carterae.1